MILALVRDPQQPAPNTCTLGVLIINSHRWQTIERPWVSSPDGPAGVPGQSCVAIGTYRLRARETEARGKHWILSNPSLGVHEWPAEVPLGKYGRTLILIHAANYAHELHGCIAPGKRRFPPSNGNPEWMVAESRAAMNELRTVIGSAIDLQLIIT